MGEGLHNLKYMFVLSLIVISACGGNMPIETPDVAPGPTGNRDIVTPPPPATSPPAMPPRVADTDIWSRDLDAINAYLREQGIVGDVFFDYDRAELRPESREKLASSAQFMRDRPEFVLAIEGHADERGTGEYNLALGDRRAQAVGSYLASLQVGPARMSTTSYGRERPVCREANETCWRQNRRAHLVVVDRRPRG